MKPTRRQRLIIALLAVFVVSLAAGTWGFYAHREINRLAVFTLPGEVSTFYKKYQLYVSTHAVDPDKRRYAATLEGPRHFIDMERFGDGKVESLPREFWAFHDLYTHLWCVDGRDSLELNYDADEEILKLGELLIPLDSGTYKRWYTRNILPAYRYELDTLMRSLPPFGESYRVSLPKCSYLRLVDTMMQHGVLPYHLVEMQQRLAAAFRQNDEKRVLQLSAEIGHYIGDASVPLHTTENYNGQLTGQRGIHAFWESRIPELFAAAEYDVLVGRATYIQDVPGFYRKLIAESHELVDSVLLIEADLRRKLPEELQECYEERLGAIVRIPCKEFARMYSDRMDGMVEERFRRAIRAVGSAWYTAWVDGGQPNLLKLKDAPTEFIVADSVWQPKPGVRTRDHE